MAIDKKAIAAMSRKKKTKKTSNKGIQFASIKEMKDSIDREFYKHLKSIFGTDEEIHKKFINDPTAYREMEGEFNMLNRN